MSFSDPVNWLWLAPFGGAIVVLWLRRPRREELVVPSLRLWQGLLAESNAQPSRRRLLRSLLLFLQLLTAFLLCLALARPFLRTQALVGQRYVLIIDNSASMQATDVQPSRLDAARQDAAQFVAQHLRPEDTALVVQTSPRARLLCRSTGDHARLRAALAQVPATDTPGDMAGALSLARSVTGTSTHWRVYSDGISAGTGTAPAASSRTDMRQIVIGTAAPDNIGITALDTRPGPAGTQIVSVRLHKAGQISHPGLTLSLLSDSQLEDARQITFQGGTAQAEFSVPLSEATQLLTVRLDHCTDDLASDNTASLVLVPPHQTRVLLVSQGSIFLERGLASLPHVAVTEIAPNLPFAAQASRADVVVLDGSFALPALPPGRFLTFGRTGPPTPFIATPQTPREVAVVGQNSAHPIMRFVDMHGIRVRSAARTQTAPWGQTLVSGSAGPLVAAGETGGSRVVSVSFAPADSDLPLRVAFPLFLAGSVTWLTDGLTPGAAQPESAAGQTASVTLPPGVRTARLLLPDGTPRSVSVPPLGNSVPLADTSQVGLYTMTVPGQAAYPVAVNLLNPSASALISRQPPLLSQAALASPPAWHAAHREWWTVAAALALLLLAAEWWFYHRRSV